MYAFIQINTDTANTDPVCKTLKELPEVKELYVLFGEWDILALVDIESADQLGNFVIEKVRTLSGVRETTTQIVAKHV